MRGAPGEHNIEGAGYPPPPLPPPPPPPFPVGCQAAPLCPEVGQRPLSVAQVLDRLRSGSAASATEACIAIRIVRAQCKFMARMGKPLKCPSLARVAVGAGLIPLLVELLAKGGHAAYWACAALSYTCAPELSADQQVPDDAQSVADARSAFSAAGGVEAAVELLKTPLRHASLEELPSLEEAAGSSLYLIENMLAGDFDRVFRIRCVDAGLVPPLVRYLAREVGTNLPGACPSISLVIYKLCERADNGAGRTFAAASRDSITSVPCIVTAFINCGIAPVLVRRLKITEGCVFYGKFLPRLPLPPRDFTVVAYFRH